MREISLPTRERCKPALRLARLGSLLLMLTLSTLLTSCSTGGVRSGPPGFAHYAGGRLYAAATFGPDGRLWRVVADNKQISVDHSDDRGQTFSAPITVNPETQKIKTGGENRPGIAVDRNGRIYVIYTAEGAQPAVVYYSVSSDGGASFSRPEPVSDRADEANTYLGKLALAPNGTPWVFWHDERDRHDWKTAGNAIYYASIDPQSLHRTPSRKVADAQCECCRLAVDFDADGKPLILVRFVYEGGVRDHGLIRQQAGNWSSWRVSFDDWKIDACPEHGPAVSVGLDGRIHMVWFTQGTVRKGLFYAQSVDGGRHFSEPKAIGDLQKLPGHADVLARGDRVTIVWREFDGQKNRVMTMASTDHGETWSPPKPIAETTSDADFPTLLSDGRENFLSWPTRNEGYRLIPLH